MTDISRPTGSPDPDPITEDGSIPADADFVGARDEDDGETGTEEVAELLPGGGKLDEPADPEGDQGPAPLP